MHKLETPARNIPYPARLRDHREGAIGDVSTDARPTGEWRAEAEGAEERGDATSDQKR
jgi:hypothetical protein